MTPRMKIELRRSEVRTRLGEIAELAGDALTENIVTERDGLMAELRTSEPQLRAAIEAEGGETRTDALDDGEGAELRALTARASIGSIFASVMEHRSTDGATAELQQHHRLAPNQIPLALVREPVEERAVTPGPTNVGTNQAAVIGGVFPRAAATWLSVDMPTVGVGEAVFPVLTQNAVVGTPAENAIPTGTGLGTEGETTGSFSAEVLSPSRLQASFFYSREDAARFMNMDIALRENLGEALSDKLDAEIIAGTDGLLAGTNLTKVAATNPTTYGGFKGLVFDAIDGKFAWGSEDVRVLVAPLTLGHMSRSFLASADSRSADEALKAAAGGVRVSAHIPAAANSKQDTIARRGMRRDMVAPMWEGVTLIPDEITKASTGQIVVTAVMLYAVKILRTDGFRRVEVQFA